MKRIGIILIMAVMCPFIQAQDSKELKEAFLDGEYFLAYEDFLDALPYYLKVYEQNTNNANINYRIGLCYLNIPGEKNKAIPYLEKAILNTTSDYKEGNFKEERAPHDAFFFLANAYQIQYKFVEAKKNYNKYLQFLEPSDTVNTNFVKQGIASCQNAKEIVKHPVYFDLLNLGNRINSASKEFAAVISGDGSTLVYVSSLKFYDALFYSKKVNGQWGLPVNITPDIKSDGDLYPTGLSYDGTQLLLTRNDRFNSDIYSSKIVDGKWIPHEKLGKNINTKFWESHASLSNDGNIMYFTSNRSGGFGGLDIYKTGKNEETGLWGNPINLGPVINSQFNEETPFICADNKTLFFSSQGHKTMGGFDIFSSEIQDDGNWSEPANIGYPINSTDDDLFFIPRNGGINGYISFSDKEPLIGREDIFYLEIFSDKNPRPVEIKGLVSLGDKPSEQTGEIRIWLGNDQSGSSQVFNVNAPEGKYSTITKVPGKYKMLFESQGFVAENRFITVPPNYSLGEIVINVNLKSVTITEPIVLKNIYFNYNSYKISKNEQNKINFVSDLLNKNLDLIIEIAGYTDSKGRTSYNKTLSLNRARSVADYFIQQGVDKNRVKVKGYGETNFIAINKNKDSSDSPEGRKYNRRVEFLVISGAKESIVTEKVDLPADLIYKK